MNFKKITPSSKEDITSILNGINTYNFSKVPATSPLWTPLEFSVVNDKDDVIGGILGGIGCWNGLEIKILWVDEIYRGQGIGKMLIQHIEAEAKKLKATIAMLDTFDFQAKDFYLKQGYAIIGILDNFPQGHQRIYFSKEL
ncbi:GNAT family N-acetyltransferase [Aquimarina rhabdastrellae]